MTTAWQCHRLARVWSAKPADQGCGRAAQLGRAEAKHPAPVIAAVSAMAIAAWRDRLPAWEAAMPYVDDIKSGRMTTAVAWTILVVAFAAAATVVVFLAAAH